MSSRSNILPALAGLTCWVGLLWAGAAPAADNSGIVIIDQQQQSTPFGRYDSRRRTEVYGPSSGFRYEEYRTPVQPVYPRYRRDARDERRGSYAYGPSYRDDRGQGRVIERRGTYTYGPYGYGRYGVPAAPRIDRFGRGHGFDRGRNNRHGHRYGGRDDDYRRSHNNQRGRAIEPAERAIEPARRAIGGDRNDRRRD
jgi:hypothetical protein